MLAHPDRRAEATGMPCRCPAGTSHPWHSQELDKIRNTVYRNLGKGKQKDGRRMQTSSSSANSAEQPLYPQAANSRAGPDAHLELLLGACLPSESEPAVSDHTCYLLSELSQNPGKTVKAGPKLLWAVSSSSPYPNKCKLGAASHLSWLVPPEAYVMQGRVLLC